MACVSAEIRVRGPVHARNTRSARDTMIVTWLHDGGLRVGALCGLRFCDLHLVSNHPCGQRQGPHVQFVGRDDNPNDARAKAYTPGSLSREGFVLDGVIRAASPDMISTLYAYLLDEYAPVQHLVTHEQVVVPFGFPVMSAALLRRLRRGRSSRAGAGVRHP